MRRKVLVPVLRIGRAVSGVGEGARPLGSAWLRPLFAAHRAGAAGERASAREVNSRNESGDAHVGLLVRAQLLKHSQCKAFPQPEIERQKTRPVSEPASKSSSAGVESARHSVS